MSFYFPRQKIYITVPYKNGFTSALNFFVSVEKFLESQNYQIQNLDNLDGININKDFSVHAKSGTYSAEPFRQLATKENLKEAEIRFFIIRDPYKRFSSFWHDRILNGPDPYFAKIHAELTSKYDLTNEREIQIAASEFLNNLSKPLTKTITNGHLWPQIYITKGKYYDFITATDDLSQLPGNLASKSDSFRAFGSHSLPALNKSTNSKIPLTWNENMKTNLEKSYKPDLIFYRGFYNNLCESALDIRTQLKKAHSEIGFYGNFLISARGTLKQIKGK